MNNPLKYKFLEKVFKSNDKELQVMKLKHRDFNQQMHAKVYNVDDPTDEGAGKLTAIYI